MSVDILQDRIRKMKCPIMLDLCVPVGELPPHLKQDTENAAAAYGRFCMEMLDAFADRIPAVRFPFTAFAVLGAEGVKTLQNCMKKAKELGYYVLLDSPETASVAAAQMIADGVFGAEDYCCDAVVISPYMGSDAMKPFLPYCKSAEKDLYVIIRSANKSAWEIQDLLTGSRNVYSAVAETVGRLGESLIGKSGYSKVCGVVGCTATDAVRTIRTKHDRLFLLVDGVDSVGGNAKNCSYAFDRFGHGAVVNAGQSVCCAWKNAETDGTDYLEQAIQAAERIKKNILRYVTIL